MVCLIWRRFSVGFDFFEKDLSALFENFLDFGFFFTWKRFVLFEFFVLFEKDHLLWKRFVLFEKDLPRLWTVKWPVLVSLMFPFTLAGTYTEAKRLCRTLEVVKHKTMQTVFKTAQKSVRKNYKVQPATLLNIDFSMFCIIRALKLVIGDPFAKTCKIKWSLSLSDLKPANNVNSPY